MFMLISFFFNATPPPNVSTLSLHDALPIFVHPFVDDVFLNAPLQQERSDEHLIVSADRKSTRLNSSHVAISYAVFCLKKKRVIIRQPRDGLDKRGNA